MSDFEREIVHCLNQFFREHHIQGFAYRFGQRRCSGQYGNVIVDSPDPSYVLSIECKSIVDKKLYFSQHFHTGRNAVHQIDAVTDFLTRTGRIGFLAVEFRQGPGKTGEAFLIPWEVVAGFFRETNGISREDARAGIALMRSNDGYVLERL